jgi:membrane protein YdbS with pleckstrin-like domain
MNNKPDHLKKHWNHWKMTLIGSAIGFVALIINLFYMFATNQLPSLARGEVFEIILFIIPLFIFLWFMRIGIWEYEEIKEEIKAETTSNS